MPQSRPSGTGAVLLPHLPTTYGPSATARAHSGSLPKGGDRPVRSKAAPDSLFCMDNQQVGSPPTMHRLDLPVLDSAVRRAKE